MNRLVADKLPYHIKIVAVKEFVHGKNAPVATARGTDLLHGKCSINRLCFARKRRRRAFDGKLRMENVKSEEPGHYRSRF